MKIVKKIAIVEDEKKYSDYLIKLIDDYFKEKNFEMLTLGEMILKADTAVVVALGNIIYEYSNFDK